MNIPRRIILAGGTGCIGQLLIRHWQSQPIDIVVLSRKPYPAYGRVRDVVWDGKTPGPWTTELDGADVLINLAGKSVDCRYTDENKRLILESRTHATAVLGKAIRRVDFMALLRRTLHVPVGLPAAAWILEIGAVVLRTETELVLKSRNVVPRKLLDAGFEFTFPTADGAVTNLTQDHKDPSLHQ